MYAMDFRINKKLTWALEIVSLKFTVSFMDDFLRFIEG